MQFLSKSFSITYLSYKSNVICYVLNLFEVRKVSATALQCFYDPIWGSNSNTAHRPFSPHHHHCLAPPPTSCVIAHIGQVWAGKISAHCCTQCHISAFHQPTSSNTSSPGKLSPTVILLSSLHYWSPNVSSPHHIAHSYSSPYHPPPPPNSLHYWPPNVSLPHHPHSILLAMSPSPTVNQWWAHRVWPTHPALCYIASLHW